MPRHSPIALKTLDRSHCQYPSRDPKGIVASARSRRDRRFSQILCRICLDVIGTKRPASRDRFEGAVRQTHHMREIERLPRQITPLAGYEVRTNLLFTMSYRTGGEPEGSPQTLKRMTFSRPAPSLLDTLSSGEEASLRIAQRQSCGLRGNGGAGRDRTDDILLAKQALSQLSYGPLITPLRRYLCRRDRQSLRIAKWWAWEDLNLRPHAYQARALTN